MSSRAALGAATFALVGVGLGAALSGGCASGLDYPDGGLRVTTILAPDQLQFEKSVSPFLERKCASLDCHGQVGRPLRLYSGLALRLPLAEGGVAQPGVGDTTGEERAANYRAAIGLEPEQMSRAVAGVVPPRKLLLLQKPLGIGHKGGPAIAPQSPGETCLTTWIQGRLDEAACTQAAKPF
jgi:hypothetical protein